MVPFTSSFTGRQQEIGDREWSSAVQKVFVLIASTILYYEYFETLPQEVARIWRAQKRLSWLNVLFYLNRYFILLGQCGVLLRAFWPGSVGDPNRLEICKALTFYHQFFGASVHLIVEAFMIIRVSALYDWSRRVMAFLLFVGIAAVTNAAISISTSKKVDWNKDNIPLNTCMLPNDEHNAHRLALAWAGLLILNIVIIMFTAKKALGDPSLQKSVILQLLLRDGTFYFGIMALLIVASVASWLTSDPYLRGSATTISNVIASCLATRLILNMRDPALYSHLKPAAVPTYPTEVTTVQWAQKKVDNEMEFDSEDSKTTFDLVTGGNITTQLATVHDYRDQRHERQRKRDESPV